MKVDILLSAVGDYMPKYQHSIKPHQALVDEIIQKAKGMGDSYHPVKVQSDFCKKCRQNTVYIFVFWK